MGTTVNGIYLPGHLEQNWDNEVNNNLRRLGDLAVNVKASGFDAVGNGVADDTPAFQAAEAAISGGGTIFVPPGIFRVGDWTPTKRITLVGSGQGSTYLQAKTSATQVLKLEGLGHCAIRDLSFDGNTKASVGLTIRSSNSVSSQSHLMDNVQFQNCSTGLQVTEGTVQQADKNTYLHCRWNDNTTGLLVNSINGQEQLLLNCTFDTHTTAVQVTNGSLLWVSGQVQSATTGVLIDGTNVQWLNMRDVIMESETTSIKLTKTPNHYVWLENCTLQGSSKCIDATETAYVTARGCRFNNGTLTFNGNDSVFIEELCVFSTSTVSFVGSNGRRFKWGIGGLEVYPASWLPTSVNPGVSFDRGISAAIVATASLPTGQTLMNGSLLIEDNGTGDRNLVIYAGGQRFRIDGGTAF